MTIPSRKLLLLLIGIIVVVSAIFISITHVTNLQTVTVTYHHARSVMVMNAANQNEQTPVKTSGGSVRIDKTKKYLIRYTGEVGYANGDVVIGKASNYDITPFYSTDKLAQLAQFATPELRKALREVYPTALSTYAIKTLRLYHYGEWAAMILQYKDRYNENSDSLRVVFQKKQSWQVATSADIILTKPANPDVPISILRQVNQL